SQRDAGPPVGRGDKKKIIALGRLAEQKSFDLFLRACGQIALRHPSWSLEIWGEGPSRPYLEELVSQLGLSDRALLPGVTPRPLEQMQQAELFVLSSRYEGFPNVLCEAMALGLAVV